MMSYYYGRRGGSVGECATAIGRAYLPSSKSQQAGGHRLGGGEENMNVVAALLCAPGGPNQTPSRFAGACVLAVEFENIVGGELLVRMHTGILGLRQVRVVAILSCVLFGWLRGGVIACMCCERFWGLWSDVPAPPPPGA